jgi:hypothetical protein
MKKFLIGLVAGLVLTGAFFLLTAFADGACHCVKPTIIVFPYAALALSRSWESASLPLIVLQFPIYSILIAKITGIRFKVLTLAIVIALHAGTATLAWILNH